VVHRYFVVCLVGVWQRNFETVVRVCLKCSYVKIKVNWEDEVKAIDGK
jgi:hypothetical protein